MTEKSPEDFTGKLPGMGKVEHKFKMKITVESVSLMLYRPGVLHFNLVRGTKSINSNKRQAVQQGQNNPVFKEGFTTFTQLKYDPVTDSYEKKKY